MSKVQQSTDNMSTDKEFGNRSEVNIETGKRLQPTEAQPQFL